MDEDFAVRGGNGVNLEDLKRGARLCDHDGGVFGWDGGVHFSLEFRSM